MFHDNLNFKFQITYIYTYLSDWIIHVDTLIISYRATCILTKQLSRKLVIVDLYLNNDNLVQTHVYVSFEWNGTKINT